MLTIFLPIIIPPGKKDIISSQIRLLLWLTPFNVYKTLMSPNPQLNKTFKFFLTSLRNFALHKVNLSQMSIFSLLLVHQQNVTFPNSKPVLADIIYFTALSTLLSHSMCFFLHSRMKRFFSLSVFIWFSATPNNSLHFCWA